MQVSWRQLRTLFFPRLPDQKMLNWYGIKVFKNNLQKIPDLTLFNLSCIHFFNTLNVSEALAEYEFRELLL